jgi:hypothetical protein
LANYSNESFVLTVSIFETIACQLKTQKLIRINATYQKDLAFYIREVRIRYFSNPVTPAYILKSNKDRKSSFATIAKEALNITILIMSCTIFKTEQ